MCLITGGAGFLGINLVRSMLDRQWPIRILDIAAFDCPERNRVEAVRGDIRDAQAVERSMQGVHTLVHCAAALPLASASEIRSTGVDGTRMLLEAATRHGVARFVFISSTAVYGIPDETPIREDHPLRGIGPYGAAKIAAEQLCRDYRQRGLCVSILRPKSFVGPERLGAFELLYDWAFDARSFPVLGRGDNDFQLLDVDDLCEVILLCLALDPGVTNDTFNVGAKHYGTMRANFQAVLDRAGHGRRVVRLPARPAVLALRVLEGLHLSPLYRWIYESADLDSVVSIDRLESHLDYTPRHSNIDALVRSYNWYVANRGAIQGHRGVSHRVPWRRGALAAAKYLF